MARVGSFVVGDGTLVGDGPLTVDEQAFFNVLAGQTPALPLLRRPARGRCAEICQFDQYTWTVGDPLPFVAAGAVRAASLTGVGFQQETLTFTVNNSAYYYARPNILQRGSWLCVRWTVETPTASTTFLGGIFRIDTVPSPDRMINVSDFQVVALDWAQPSLLQRIQNAFVGPKLFTNALEVYLTTGLPLCVDITGFVPGGVGTWGNVIAGLVVQYSGAPSQGIGGDNPQYGLNVLVPWGTQLFVAPQQLIQIGDPGKMSSIYDVLAFLFFEVGGFTLAYGNDGKLLLFPGGPIGRDSGYYISTDTTKCGAVPLPWTLPLSRAITRPQFAQVQHGLHILPDPAAIPGTLAAQDFGPTINLVVNSTSPVNPFDPQRDNVDITIETVPEPLGVLVLQTNVMGIRWGFWKLSTALGPADVITLQVDSAFPPPPLGQLVRIHAPPDADGYYRLVAFSQPLAPALAQWTLQWWSDGPDIPDGPNYPRLMSVINALTPPPNELPFVWANWLHGTGSDFVGVYLQSAPQSTDPLDAIATVSTGGVFTGTGRFIDLDLVVSSNIHQTLYELRGVYGSPPQIVIGTPFILFPDANIPALRLFVDSIGPVPNMLSVGWSAWVGSTVSDFIGIYATGAPISLNMGDALLALNTDGTADGALNFSDVALPVGTYEVRGVYGSPATILIGPQFDITA